jgi:methylmalonyl-CoA mutase cobalamin-binding domain/chain
MSLEKIFQAIVDLDIENIAEIVKISLKKGSDPYQVLDYLRRGMDEVGRRFELGEYFLADLVMAGETMKMAMEVLTPYLRGQDEKVCGKVVLGTIQGDLHDIGKDIVKALLSSAGFEVYDLGIDVPPEKFVDKAKEVGARVIAISSLLSTTVPVVGDVVKELKKANLRDKIKVIIGGAAVRPYHVEKYGVDAAVNDAVKGVEIIKSWALSDEFKWQDGNLEEAHVKRV